jgi:hypothetical protein
MPRVAAILKNSALSVASSQVEIDDRPRPVGERSRSIIGMALYIGKQESRISGKNGKEIQLWSIFLVGWAWRFFSRLGVWRGNNEYIA